MPWYDPRPARPWRGRCPICPKRSTSGYEQEEHAAAWGDEHLERRHHLTHAEVERLVGHPVSTSIYIAKEAT